MHGSTASLRLLGAGLLAATGAACSDPPPLEPLARVDLRAATGQADARVIGVAIDGAGARTLLDEQQGLYRLDADGRATALRSLAAFPDPGVEVRPPYTDLVALGPDRFALTAIGDGFLLDLTAGTMAQYFCYEPGGFPDDQEQRTSALTYDPAADRLYAQPRTFDLDGNLLRSELAAYAADTGADLSWQALPLGLDAGGLVVAPGGGALVLGAGSTLHRYDLARAELSTAADLERYGVTAIAGLALDTTTGTLVVIDGADDELVELDPAALGL